MPAVVATPAMTPATPVENVAIEVDTTATMLKFSTGVICALAAPVPSHEVTPDTSPGICNGAPSALRTIADEPSIKLAFKPRRIE